MVKESVVDGSVMLGRSMIGHEFALVKWGSGAIDASNSATVTGPRCTRLSRIGRQGDRAGPLPETERDAFRTRVSQQE